MIIRTNPFITKPKPPKIRISETYLTIVFFFLIMGSTKFGTRNTSVAECRGHFINPYYSTRVFSHAYVLVN